MVKVVCSWVSGLVTTVGATAMTGAAAGMTVVGLLSRAARRGSRRSRGPRSAREAHGSTRSARLRSPRCRNPLLTYFRDVEQRALSARGFRWIDPVLLTAN